ncbi:Hypothetical predicted protein [Cloeon dipterum]|uniref:Peptidase S1 domain-containing protein n=1 Tax=Cloeon dipterum TaxID=197152 RepID=A0A8S1E4K1_9INSE|nr:Hypothetical predicted protein [Cloeon dipterum]
MASERRERKRFWRAIRIENRLLSGKDSHTESTLSQDGSDSTEEDEDMNRKEDDLYKNITAHCVDQKGSTLEAGSLVVALGKELLNSGWTKDDGVSIHSVRSVIKHEEYDHNLVKNDIALLQLTRSVETTITVSPLCLWYKSSNFELLNNVNGTIAGWGLIQDYNLADQLQRLDLPILNPDQCKLIEGKETFYSTKMRASPKFCAGYINRNKSPCNGDSGAALVVEENGVFYARGIVSETVAKNIDNGKFCNTDYPAIFTDVAAYRRWIIDHTDDELKYSYVP